MGSLRGASILAAIVALGCSDTTVEPRNLPAIAAGALTSKGDALLRSGGGPAKVYCAGSACWAAMFEFKDYNDDPTFPGRPYTIFSAYFQNLQGTYPRNGSAERLALNNFHFEFFDSNEGDAWVDADGGYRSFQPLGTVVDGNEDAWENDSPASGLNYDIFWTPFGGIIGCDGRVPEFPLEFFSFQTCPSEGLDGWVRVDFKLRRVGPFASNEPVRFRDFRFSFSNFNGNRCSIGGNEPPSCSEMPYNRVMKP